MLKRLGLVWPEPPELKVFAKGLARFRTIWPNDNARPPSATKLLALGSALWSSERKKKTEAEAEAVTETEPVPFVWTTQRVMKALLRITTWAALLWRRAVWVRLLSESVVVWQPKGGEGLRVIVVEAGRFGAARDLTDGGTLAPPPGWSCPLGARHKTFDRHTYDRLRVLTTELRRVVGDGCIHTVRFGVQQQLDADHLADLLSWV